MRRVGGLERGEAGGLSFSLLRGVAALTSASYTSQGNSAVRSISAARGAILSSASADRIPQRLMLFGQGEGAHHPMVTRCAQAATSPR